MHHLRADVQDGQDGAHHAEGEEGGALPEECGRARRARGQACQGACADAQTGHTGHQGRKLDLRTYFDIRCLNDTTLPICDYVMYLLIEPSESSCTFVSNFEDLTTNIK